MPADGVLHLVSLRRDRFPGIAQSHECGDAVFVVDHTFSAHLGRVGGEHGHDGRAFQHLGHRSAADPLRLQRFQRFGHGRALFACYALPVLGQIGEQREQHEAAHEIQRTVQVQRLQFRHGRGTRSGAAVAVHAGAANRLGLVIKRFTAISADHIAKHTAQKADVGILRNRGKVSHGQIVRCNI